MSNSFNYHKDNAENRFLDYNGKIVLKSNNKNNQIVFNKILSVFNKNQNETLDSDEIKNIWKNVINADSDKDGVISLEEITAYIKRNKLLSKLNINPKNLIWVLNVINKTIGNRFKQTSSAVEKRLVANFKKKYTTDKYNIKIEKDAENHTTLITVTKKGSKNPIKSCLIEENGEYEINDNNENPKRYDKNGKLVSYTKNKKEGNCNVKIKCDPISDAIYKDITAKNKAGLPTTGKNLENHIKQITPQNIKTILENYKKNYDESLLDAINKEWGLDKQVKRRLLQHLNECTKKSRYWSNNEPNTIIDKDMSQGNIGDCWLLGAIAAIAVKPKGLRILNSCIKKTADGNYLVKFKGADKTYTVTPLEICDRSDFTNQDLDIRILEIAADKHFNILGISSGGLPANALDLIMGTKDKWKNIARAYNPVSNSKDQLTKIIKNPNNVVMTHVNFFTKIGMGKNKEYSDEISTQHAYAVVDIDDKYVYLKNPWKVEKLSEKQDNSTFRMPIEDFQKYLENVQYVTLE